MLMRIRNSLQKVFGCSRSYMESRALSRKELTLTRIAAIGDGLES